MWRSKLKELGHSDDGAYTGLLEWFEKNPGESLSTHRMGQLGLRHWKKGRREWSVYNQATLERKARALCNTPFNLLESYKSQGYVYFRPKEGLEGQIQPSRPLPKPHMEIRNGVPTMVYA